MKQGGERCVYFPSSGKFFSALDSTRLSGAFLTSIFVSQEARKLWAFQIKYQEAIIYAFLGISYLDGRHNGAGWKLDGLH